MWLLLGLLRASLFDWVSKMMEWIREIGMGRTFRLVAEFYGEEVFHTVFGYLSSGDGVGDIIMATIESC